MFDWFIVSHRLSVLDGSHIFVSFLFLNVSSYSSWHSFASDLFNPTDDASPCSFVEIDSILLSEHFRSDSISLDKGKRKICVAISNLSPYAFVFLNSFSFSSDVIGFSKSFFFCCFCFFFRSIDVDNVGILAFARVLGPA